MDKIYRGAVSSPSEKKASIVNQDDLVYRGVTKNTTYYNLAKIRSTQKKRKLFYSGLELYSTRQYIS